MAKQNTLKKSNNPLGVAPVIGFLLIMAILFIAAGQYQANVVPVQEREEEVNHFQNVNDQINGLRTQIIRSSSNGNIQTQEIQSGLVYSTLGVTAQSASGNLILRDLDRDKHNITIRNAENNGEADNFWRGDVDREYDTGLLEYDIDYNRFSDNSEIWIEHGLVYRDTIKDNNEVINMIQESQQPIINGRNIRLYTLQSGAENINFTESGVGQMRVEVQPTSAPMNSVSISDYSLNNDPINISIPTRLNKSDWSEVFSSQMDDSCSSNGKYLKNLKIDDFPDSRYSQLHMILCKGETYNLQMSRIDLQTIRSRSRIPQPEEQYIAVDDKVINVREESVVNLETQARDRYNNGIVGVPILAEAHETAASSRCVGNFRGRISEVDTICDNSNDKAQPAVSISDSSGDAGFTYSAPEVATDKEVTFVYRFDT